MTSTERLMTTMTLGKAAGRGRNFMEGSRSFRGDLATGVAWGLGGAAVDKGVDMLSHLGKRKKPKPDADQNPEAKQAVIKSENGSFALYTHDGRRLLGKHPTHAKAVAQEQAIKAHGG